MSMLNIHQISMSAIIPGILLSLWLTGLITFATFKTSIITCFVVFVVLPFLFKFSLRLQREVMFLTFIHRPSNSVFKSPASLGIHATRNFYITYNDEIDDFKVSLGVWHVLPNQIAKRFSKQLKLTEKDMKSLANTKTQRKYEKGLNYVEKQIESDFPEVNDANEQDFFEKMLRIHGSRIIFYLHGNCGSRAAAHRIELYKILRESGYHVIAFDYRGYGDSSPVPPTESGLIRDAIAVYNYITSITKNPVIAWGHSLGTGIATHTLATLEHQNISGPRLLILESPFNNMRDEISEHPLALIFRHLPWFNYTIVNPIVNNILRLESDKQICTFQQPTIILHAEDDFVVPCKLGYKLYRTAKANRRENKGSIEFYRFSSGYGHISISRAPELSGIVDKFADTYFT